MTGNPIQPHSDVAGEIATRGSGQQRGQGMLDVASARSAQEVQAAMVIAQRFPRDPIGAEQRILQSCRRMSLAEQAFYSYSKGGSKIHGPTIHLARMMAAQWGNCEAGWTVLEQNDERTIVMAYCWDFETNYRSQITFEVRHEMKARGEIKTLTDPRDIYEHCANMAARRVRACILAVLPIETQEAAVEQCKQTLAGSSEEPLIDRVKKMVSAFGQFSVTKDMIETRLGHKLDATDASELVTLRGIFQSLKDGMSRREDWFQVAPESESDEPADLTEGKKQTTAQQAQNTRQQASEFFGEDLANQQEPAPDEPANDTDIEKVKQVANLKLDEAQFDGTGENRNALIQGLVGDMASPPADVNQPTRAETERLTEAVKALDADATAKYVLANRQE